VEEFVECEESFLATPIDRIRKAGFINFYGEQRLGEPGLASIVGTRPFEIGKAMLRGDFAQAIHLLLSGRLVGRDSDSGSFEVCEARRVWKETRDALKTWENLPAGKSMARERLVLRGLKRYNNDSLAAWRCLPYHERMFFVQSYQSFIWNQMTTARVKLFGMQVAVGDLVRSDDGEIVEVTEENIASYSIRDVILPLPGYNVTYPANMRAMYADVLGRDEIAFQTDAPAESTAKGSYRRLLASVTNLSYSIERTGSGLDLFLSFDLKSGSYATMMARELFRTTVFRGGTYAPDSDRDK
jgi:tRNA pseudouridine13 synthase